VTLSSKPSTLPIDFTVTAKDTDRLEFKILADLSSSYTPNSLSFTIIDDNWGQPISIQVRATQDDIVESMAALSSSIYHGQGLTLVPISVQLELISPLPLNFSLLCSPHTSNELDVS